MSSDMVTLDIRQHPYSNEGRSVHSLPLDEFSGPVPGDFEVWVDGRRVEAGVDVLGDLHGGSVVVCRPRPGRGVLRTLAQLALVVAAAVAIPLIGGVWGAVAGLGITLGGSLILNTLFPIEETGPVGLPRSADPSFTLSSGRNRVLQYGSYKCVLGTHRLFPDLSALPYSTFDDDDQFLYMIFDLGLGDIDVSDIRIGDTALSSFDPVPTQHLALAGADIAGIAGDVTTVTVGVEFTFAEKDAARPAWVSRSFDAGPVSLEFDYTGRVFAFSDKGEYESRTVTVAYEYKKRASTSWTPRTVTITNDGPEIKRKTVMVTGLDKTSAYDLRSRAISDKEEKGGQAVAWASFRTFEEDTSPHVDKNRLGLIIQATGQLSGSVDQLNCMVSQKVPVRRNDAWTSPEASSNPAWIFRHYARGISVNGVIRVGEGYAADRIDDAQIIAWGAWCDSHNPPLRYNAVVDASKKSRDVLADIARAGRAVVNYTGGKVSVEYEDSGASVSGVVTPGNMVAGTFGFSSPGDEIADEVTVRYIEPGLDWQYNTVRRKMPGVTTVTRPASPLTLAGVTVKEQAALFANLLAASNLYHRRLFSWDMPSEGLLFHKGDVVNLTHGLVDGGSGGRLKSIASNGESVSIHGDAVELSAGDKVMLVWPDDGSSTVFDVDVSSTVTQRTIPLESAIPSGKRGVVPVDTKFHVYPASVPPVKVRIIGVESVGRGQYRFKAIDESAQYHAAATSDLNVPLPARATRVPKIERMDVSDLLKPAGAGFVLEVEVNLTVSGDWQNWTFQVFRGDVLVHSRQITGGDTVASWVAYQSGTVRFVAIPGSFEAPVGEAVSVTHQLRVATDLLGPPDAPGGFQVTSPTSGEYEGIRYARWTLLDRPDVKDYEILFSESTTATVGSMTSVGRFASPIVSGNLGTTQNKVYRYAIRAITISGLQGLPAYFTTAKLPYAPGYGIPGNEDAFALSTTGIISSHGYPDDDWGFGEQTMVGTHILAQARNVVATKRSTLFGGNGGMGFAINRVVPPEWCAGDYTFNGMVIRADGRFVELTLIDTARRRTAYNQQQNLYPEIEQLLLIHITLEDLSPVRVYRIPAPRGVGVRTSDTTDPYTYEVTPAFATRLKAMYDAFTSGGRVSILFSGGLLWQRSRPFGQRSRCRFMLNSKRPVVDRPAVGDAVSGNWVVPPRIDSEFGRTSNTDRSYSIAPSLLGNAPPPRNQGYGSSTLIPDPPVGGASGFSGASGSDDGGGGVSGAQGGVSGQQGALRTLTWSPIPQTPTQENQFPVFADRSFVGDVAVGDYVPEDFGAVTGLSVPGFSARGYETVYARTSTNFLVARTQLPRREWKFGTPGVVGGVSYQTYQPPPTVDFPYVWSVRRPYEGAPNVGDTIDTDWETPVFVQRGVGTTPPPAPAGQNTETIYLLSELESPASIAPANDFLFQQPKTSGTLVNSVPGGTPRRQGSWVASNASNLAASSWTLTNSNRVRMPREWTRDTRIPSSGFPPAAARDANQYVESIVISSTGQVTLNLSTAASDPQGLNRTSGDVLNHNVLDDMEIDLVAGTNQRVAAGPPSTDRTAPYTWTDSEALAFVQALVTAGAATAVGYADIRSGYPWYSSKPVYRNEQTNMNVLPAGIGNIFDCDRYYEGTLVAGAEVAAAWQTVERGSAN